MAIDRRDRDVAILAGAIIAMFAVLLASKGVLDFRLSSYLTNLILFGYVAVAWIVVRILKLLVIDRPDAPTRMIMENFFRRSHSPRYISALVVLLCLIAFMPAFSAMKSAVPLFNDYKWDDYFINLDRQIHGDDAWKVLQSIIGVPMLCPASTAFLTPAFFMTASTDLAKYSIE